MSGSVALAMSAASVALAGAGTGTAVATQIRFSDATATSGVDFRHATGRGGPDRPEYFLPEIMGSGLAVLDFDGDGDLDLLLIQGRGPDGLFENVGPGIRFAPRPDHRTSGPPPPDAYGMGVAVGDVDGDGDLDVFRTARGPDAMLNNDGGGRFEPSPASGTADAPWMDGGWSASAAFCDYDSDGWLDLFVTRYMDYDPDFACHARDGRRDYCGPTDIPGLPDRLYRNVGGAFFDVSRSSGIGRFAARGLGVACHDFTGDGRLDFYVANDTEANHLWVNAGDGTFSEQALLRGVALSGLGRPEAGMGVDVGDMDRDAVLDVLLTHFADETNTLYFAEPGGYFADRSNAWGFGSLGLARTGFGAVLADFDHDGRLDAAIANGRVARPPGEGPREPFFASYAENGLLLRGEDGRFADARAAAPAFAATPRVGRGLVAGDLDGDGDLDLVVASVGGAPLVLRNDAPAPDRFLIVEPRTAPDGRLDHGAVAVVETTTGRFASRANPGHGYLSSGPAAAHFGLPPGAEVVALTIRWSDGTTEAFPAPSPGVRFAAVRGAGVGGATGEQVEDQVGRGTVANAR